MVKAENLCLKAGYGIVDDANADTSSPRQVLLIADTVYDELNLPPTSLRENLRIRGLDQAVLGSGQVIQIGERALLRLTLPCEPCSKLNSVRKGLAEEIAGQRGMLARVIRAGRVYPCDSAVVLNERLPALSQSISERAYGYIQAVPRGKVVTYSQITRAIGVSKNYARVMPRILLSAPEHVPTHRVLSTNRTLIDKHIIGQKEILRREGVPMNEQDIVDRAFVWDGSHFVADEKLFEG